MTITYYVGLDVHKETISIAYALAGSRENPNYHGQCSGSIASVTNALKKLADELKVEFQALKVCYEAGPTCFVIARHLIKKSLDCVLMSPSKTERKPGDKIKTDKRDACDIARLFRNGDITQVRIPPVLDEAVCDVCRARTDATDDLIRAKQRLNAFLLRNGYHYTGKSKWTIAHMRYLRELVMTLISELETLRRFDHPRKLMAFLGLVPSEASSGGKNAKEPSPSVVIDIVAECLLNNAPNTFVNHLASAPHSPLDKKAKVKKSKPLPGGCRTDSTIVISN